MKGDFSHLQFDPTENFNGVLQQQGRVLLDRDWNEQSRIIQHWEDRAGEDVIGAGLAAVPVLAPDGFKVVQANVVGTSPNQRVELQLLPGRVWADGLLCYLPPNATPPASPVTRVADYLPAPIDDTPGTIATIAPGVRDIVVLEVSREELSAFQVPDRLLEPALGGVDTTERVLLRTAFKLYRAGTGETCHNLGDKLKDDPADKGHLTVRLQPTVTVPGDCPVVMGGGYTGFEHFLYRVEIAAVNTGQPAGFKWSQFNGGLVGRGQLVTTPTNRISIRANHAAIVNSGLSSFYCEVIAFDAQRGIWKPTFGAEVTLSGADLVVGTVRLGAFAASGDTVFFRLWNGFEPIADFDNASPVELIDGIQLKFTPATATNYAPGDFWTFTVRAGEIPNAEVLIDDKVPFGPIYHRVALAEINWGTVGTPVVPPAIEDCRRRFRPLTRQDTCCTVRVGDGEQSLGDYLNIQNAIDSLPPEGGTVCILPGIYHQEFSLDNRQNVTISGCGGATLLLPSTAGSTTPIITINGGRNLCIESVAIETNDDQRGIYAVGNNPFVKTTQTALDTIRGLVISDVIVESAKYAGITVEYARDVRIVACSVRQRDITCIEHALVVRADDAEIARNTIEVPVRTGVPTSLVPASGEEFIPGSMALGGLHLKSLCERVRVIDNLIRGGCGHGITLGSLAWYTEAGDPVPPENEPVQPAPDPCDPTHPTDGGILVIVVEVADGTKIHVGSGGPLYDVRIERNRIHAMGSDGIGVIGFFDLSDVDEFISVVNLSILGNEIRQCLRRATTPPTPELEGNIAYGGIILGNVENLIVHDNVILDTGADWLDPVCGIFVLHAEGIDLCRNRIVNCGARTAQPITGARPGQRGGIVVKFSVPPIALLTQYFGGGIGQNGVPSLRVHQNIVSQPLGRALVAAGVGPMSIVGNQFTSQAVTPMSVDLMGFMAGSVQIMNLGMSNELYLQLLLFAFIGKKYAQAYMSGVGDSVAGYGRAGLDDATLGRLLANGQVQFSDNQVNLDLLAQGLSLALTSTFIVTLDDLACHDNQFEANLFDDFLLSHSIHMAFTQSNTGNRWKEGLFNALLSALTLSFTMNTTTDNQGTHCIIARGMPTHTVDDHNIALVQGVQGEVDGMCDGFSKLFSNWSKMAGGPANSSNANNTPTATPGGTPPPPAPAPIV